MSKGYNDFDPALERLYGLDKIDRQTERYELLTARFENKFSSKALHLFSAPGRIEIGGNHTDHNNGRVLSAAVNLDAIAIAAPNGSRQVKIISEGYSPFRVDLDQLDILENEYGTTPALIRGIASGLKEHGCRIGGFDACLQSDVPPGSGLSSSASFEVLVAAVFNALFNENQIAPEAVAKYCQYAENVYFKKPCGLMDQMTCAMGGVLNLDFRNPQNPSVKRLDLGLKSHNYRVLVVEAGQSHSDLTDDYAAIPTEMKSVARALGGEVCRDITAQQVMGQIRELRNRVGDRAVLRALHFLEEDKRVVDQVMALEEGEFDRFISLVNESGNSSFKWLQNIYTAKNPREQGLSLALALTARYISDTGAGACRVQGGGFAGTILVFLPEDAVKEYRMFMDPVFGPGSVRILDIRPYGALTLKGVSVKEILK